jgi:subtilisin family serine protease
VDVFAPGVDIHSTIPDGYEANSGTSMAAPVVSGLAALLMAYFPELSAGEVRCVILETATAGELASHGQADAEAPLMAGTP